AVGSAPSFKQLTFQRGHIDAARFAPDGQTGILNASWNGMPFELSAARLDTRESTALPNHEAQLLSVSRSGDPAVLVRGDVLARVPIGGAGTRDLLEHVSDADWAPDGTLAVVRGERRRMWVEYPQGTVIYKAQNAIDVLRVSPDGSLVAVMEQETQGGG